MVYLNTSIFNIPFSSKFRHANDCYDFASTYLGIYPYRTDDHPDGDDYFFDYDYSDDYYEDCCFQYSIDEGCPLPLCGEGQTEPQYHRRLSADASSTAHDAPDQVLQLKTVKWWETDAFKAKLAARASKKAATPAAAASTATTEAHTAAATSTTSSSSSDADKTVQSAKQVLAYPYRESSLVQIRNGACLYEEKYDLWYKQTCHGKSTAVVVESMRPNSAKYFAVYVGELFSSFFSSTFVLAAFCVLLILFYNII